MDQELIENEAFATDLRWMFKIHKATQVSFSPTSIVSRCSA